jgi:predicted transcriptional regulator
MRLRWQTVDKWRQERDLTKAEFARKIGAPESTVYRGLKHNSKLQPTTVTVIRTIFPDKFDRNGELVP